MANPISIINVWSLIFRQTTQGAILVQLEMLLEGIHMTELLEFKVLTMANPISHLKYSSSSLLTKSLFFLFFLLYLKISGINDRARFLSHLPK
jgi:hypothetical protein